jgi:DNA-binding NarL/FixJ family response regulator
VALLAQAEAGNSVRPRDPAIDALSQAELRVADAVAGGLTNREVAATLLISVKTVDFHLQQIYRKIGVRSRTELAVRMAGHGRTATGERR